MAKQGKRSNQNRRTTAPVPKKPQEPTVRSIGQIIDLGPNNDLEMEKLKRYERYRATFYANQFKGLNATPELIRSAVDQALRHCSLVRSDLRHAIQTQHLTESQQRLAGIAAKARELLQNDTVRLHTEPKSSSEPESTQLIGSGGFPANSCQMCGRYLTTVCYSTVYNANRVPRTDKICMNCFQTLPQSEKELYYSYEYGRRPEPRGLGWKPEGEWGN